MIYYLLAFLHGLLNSVNRLINVEAGKKLGTANGALINYVEATVLSLFLIFLTGHGAELSAEHMGAVPVWVYLGSIAGLAAQLLQIVGTMKTNALISSILMLAGNLGMAVVLDYLFYRIFSPGRTIGIFLVLLGTVFVERARKTNALQSKTPVVK